MGWTPLATETHNTSQYSSRGRMPNLFVLHHGATTDLDQIISMMVTGSRQVSAHVALKDGRIAGVVQEQFRAWSLSSAEFDGRAFTVECANESPNGWTISAESHESLARLVADWSTRYGIPINRSGDPRTWTLLGHREVYSIWGASYATACPGGMYLDWIANRAIQIQSEIIQEEDIMRFAYSVTPAGDIIQKYLMTDNGLTPINDTQEEVLWRANGSPKSSYANFYPEEIVQLNETIRATMPPIEVDSKALAEALAPYMKGATKLELEAAVAAIVKVVPTAVENGAAARAAIVK